MEVRNIVFAVILVLSTIVITERLWVRYQDPVVAFSVVILAVMFALLFLSVDHQLRRLKQDISEKEQSLRVSMQSVEEYVREKMDTATWRLGEIREDIMKRGYR